MTCGRPAEWIWPEDDPVELARRLAARGPRQVVLKLGGAGCVALIDEEVFTSAAVQVPVVDTVGAGDAFVAGYLAELVNDADPRRRIATAVQTGAFACTNLGDWEGAATRRDLGRLGASESVTR